jgi:hypothetical protein
MQKLKGLASCPPPPPSTTRSLVYLQKREWNLFSFKLIKVFITLKMENVSLAHMPNKRRKNALQLLEQNLEFGSMYSKGQ